MTGERPSLTDLGMGGDAAAASAQTCLAAVEPAPRAPRPVKTDPNRLRLCIVTRTEQPPDGLIRFVLGPDGQIVPDLGRRLPGRGVWVTATRECVAVAIKRGLFAKSLKQPVKAGKELVDQVEKLLAFEARQALSLANKAGLVTTGFSKVEIALEKGVVEVLLAASDASPDGTGKLARKFRAIRGAAHREAPVIGDFSSAELDLAFGGSNVIHAAVAAGVLSRRVGDCCRRLKQFRSNSDRADLGTDAVRAGSNSASGSATTSAAINAEMNAREPGVSGIGENETKSDQAGTDHA